MAEQIIELISTPRVTNALKQSRTAEIVFRAIGFTLASTTLPDSARLQQYVEWRVTAHAEAIFGQTGFLGWPLVNVRTDADAEHWLVTLTYSTGQENSSSFDISTESQRIVLSKATSRWYPESAPLFGGFIGVVNKEPQGCDILSPVQRFTEKRTRSKEEVEHPNFRATVFEITGTTNNAAFMNFEEAEVLFLGVRTTPLQGDKQYEVTYEFAWAPNKYHGGQGIRSPIEMDLKSGSVSIDKDAWEYLWVHYGDGISGDPPISVKIPIAAYVERVYDESDFSRLML